jgi:hypothetical protein
VDVPRSKCAFALRGQQIRYLAVFPWHTDPIRQIELIKGPDDTAPIVMAVTVEKPCRRMGLPQSESSPPACSLKKSPKGSSAPPLYIWREDPGREERAA